jgi:hypothetical protein
MRTTRTPAGLLLIRWALALALASLAGPGAVAAEQVAADAATASRLPDLRCFAVQGRCAPGAVPTGQTLASPNQIHNAFVGGWGPGGKAVGNVWKHLAVSRDWVASANILPVAVHCDTYLAFVKNPAGVPQELWCIDGPRLLLLWEMLDATHGRYWTRQDGSMGIVLFDGRFRTGTFWLNTTDEQHFTCVDGAAVHADLDAGVQDVESALGPFDVSNGRARSRTVSMLRTIGIVPGPDEVPDDVALPPSWIQEVAAAGKLGGPQPASLFLLQAYWGGITCPAGGNPEACAAGALHRETVWLVRVGSESSGYERWMNQSQNGEGSGQWLAPAPGSIGTTTSVVFEGDAPLLPAVPCRQ